MFCPAAPGHAFLCTKSGEQRRRYASPNRAARSFFLSSEAGSGGAPEENRAALFALASSGVTMPKRSFRFFSRSDSSSWQTAGVG